MKNTRMFLSFIGIFFVFNLIGQEKYVNDLGMEFIQVPAGEMIVGKLQPTVSRMIAWGSNEPLNEQVYQQALVLSQMHTQPGFKVLIQKPFYIGKYEVTQGQWKKIMGTNPSYFQQSHRNAITAEVIDPSANHPVENITWNMAQRFIKKLNRKDKKFNYHLPTEIEWEYAARAGAEDDISWDAIQSMAVIADTTTSMVGQKAPNAWGIYDMLGNVWEWVEDYYNEKIFADPLPPTSGKQHVLKGSCFYGDVKNATYTTHAAGPGSGFDTGLRLVMEIK